jgi:phosphocarrier protein
MIEKKVELIQEEGFHTNLITELVGTASQFHSELYLSYNGRKVNLKSLMGVLSLGIPGEATLQIKADGKDEEEALQSVLRTLSLY